MSRKKETRTELQQAADRVAEITAAMKPYEEDLVRYQEDVRRTWLAHAEACRNLDETQAFLAAQRRKQETEVTFAAKLLEKFAPF